MAVSTKTTSDVNQDEMSEEGRKLKMWGQGIHLDKQEEREKQPSTGGGGTSLHTANTRAEEQKVLLPQAAGEHRRALSQFSIGKCPFPSCPLPFLPSHTGISSPRDP